MVDHCQVQGPRGVNREPALTRTPEAAPCTFGLLRPQASAPPPLPPCSQLRLLPPAARGLRRGLAGGAVGT